MSYIGVQPFGQTVRTVTTITATASQTTFSPNGGYTVGYCDVYYNGIKLVEGQDYNASNGTTVVLTTGATANAVVDIVTYGTVTITDAVRRSGDTFAGAVAINSTLAAGNTTITGNTTTTTLNAGNTIITGTLSASANVNLDSGTLFVDGTNNRVGVNTTTPGTLLDVQAANAAGGIKLTSTTGTNAVYAQMNNTGGGFFIGRDNSTGSGFALQSYASLVWSQGSYPLLFATNDTLRMTIDSSGRVVKPYQPAFDAYGTVGNVLFTTETPLPLDSTTFNIGSHYSTSTFRFTAPVAGIYFFRAQVYKQSSGNASRLRLYKNGSNARVYQYISSSDVYTHSITGIISLAINDYVTCTFNGDGAGTNVYLADNHTNFSGYLLG